MKLCCLALTLAVAARLPAPAAAPLAVAPLTDGGSIRQTAPVQPLPVSGLLADSNELVRLTAELQKQVGQASPNVLPVDAYRKAVAIAVLARRVKEQTAHPPK